jgi:LmbE family N-acetylglucosaminyl deacetylase
MFFENMGKKIVLVIAPHPDDEVLGCGGTIKRFTEEGNKVFVLIVTAGSPKYYTSEGVGRVRDQALKAHAVLGVERTYFFDFPAPELDIISNSEIAVAIEKVIRELGVTDLFLPHQGDIHHDHGAVFRASMVASRPIRGNTVKRIYCYETLSETEWAFPFGEAYFIPTHFVDITNFLDSKISAMQQFTSQIQNFPHPRSVDALEALSKFRGSTVGFNHAEAFITIRTIS